MKSIIKGISASIILLAVYFSVLSALSGWEFAKAQFNLYWYLILGLSAGFGIQVGLYSCLKKMIKQGSGGKVVAVSGATSTVAMISCCTHYLTNILPIVAASGMAAFAARFQTEFFWVGILLNIFGIAHISRKIIRFNKIKLNEIHQN